MIKIQMEKTLFPLIGILAFSLTAAAQEPDCNSCHLGGGKNALEPVRQIQAESDRGYGVMDKGSLANITGNFGVLSNYHVFFQYAMHWPSWADDTHQYCFGLAPIVAVEDNVVESITQFSGVDWEAQDGGFGTQFSGDVRAASDDTPFLASSDILDTWPMVAGERTWPGPFRLNLGTINPYDQVQGEFASDRDIWGIYDDGDNQVQPLGIECTQMSYGYNRTYAEDFVFFDLNFSNQSATLYDTIYVGHYGDFRVDYDNADLLKLVDSDGDGQRDFLYYWDADGQITEPWVVMGLVGIAILNTPADLGLTDFHYFNHAKRPENDYGLWPIIGGLPDLMQSRGFEPADFFHGTNPRFDDPENVAEYYPPNPQVAPAGGGPLDYFLMTRLENFAPGDTVRLSLAVVMGEDEDDLFANLDMAQQMADLGFQGSGPPAPPLVSVTPGDHQATLYWSPEPSQSSVDAVTGQKDFEGFKVYRSSDQGQTWGTEVRDYTGDIKGYVPLAIFDKADGVQGADPFAPWQSLGTDSGLEYAFTDSGLVNGVEYWYAVCAYDKGFAFTEQPSLQNGFGSPEVSTHIIAVVPGVNAQTYIPNPYGIDNPILGPLPEAYIAYSGPPTKGSAFVEVINPDSLTGHDYRIAISDSMPQPTGTAWWDSTCFSIIDLTAGDTLVAYQPLYALDANGYPKVEKPIVEGMRFTVDEAIWFGWTLINGDSCNFDWFRDRGDPNVGEAYLQGDDSFRLTVDYSGGSMDSVEDAFDGYYAPIWVPFKVELITDPENPLDVSELCWITDYERGIIEGNPAMSAFSPNTYFSPADWDLEPGGAGYNPYFGNTWPDELSFRYYSPSGDTSIVNIRTQNIPYLIAANGDTMTGIKPSQGDQFTVLNTPLSSANYFDFSTVPAGYTVNSAAVDLSQIKVVPNPYIVTAGWETTANDHRLQFTHLPPQCTIKVYTVSGNLIKTLYHESSTEGYLFWDLRTESKQDVAFGLYIYHVQTPEGKEFVNRFVVIR